MQFHLSSWPEIEAYLARSKAIVIPIGSTYGTRSIRLANSGERSTPFARPRRSPEPSGINLGSDGSPPV